MKHDDITGQIIKAFYTVYNVLGHGFLEKVYENAMMLELEKTGLSTIKQKSIKVYYDGQIVGNYFADIIVSNKVIVELKAASTLMDAHQAQLLNYLKATDIEVGLLLNFGAKPQISRKLFDNHLK